MAQNIFHFQLGDFACLAVRDTIEPLLMDFNFSTVQMTDILALSRQYNIPLSDKFEISNLLVRTGQHTVLIDTGNGMPAAPKINVGMLIENLQTVGIYPHDIDTVIISHAHPDHIGGNVDSAFKPCFPDAQYFIHETEWEFWSSEPELKEMNDMMRQDMLGSVHRNLISIKDKIIPVKAGIDIIPGFQYIPVPGHTPGHAAVSISSGVSQLIYVADTFHNVMQLTRPDWVSPFDIDFARAADSRKQIIDHVLSCNTLVFSSHYPFPSIGHIIQKDGLCFWQPGL
jgi:glyoxylase-like metal-dependent hydrolase (beta-lactamase superfamily II)